jgi:hypothetical protein
VHKKQRPPRGVAVRHYLSLPARGAELPTWGTRLRRIDRERTASEGRAVESGNGGLGRLVVGHLHKPKASGTASVTVHDDMDLVHGTIRLEELAEVMLSRAERQIANKDVHVQILFFLQSMETIARSSEQYAEAKDARVIRRRNGEKETRKHKVYLILT